MVGLVFGLVNLALSWLYPLADDTPVALLRFYGPMFLVWAFASFRASRRSGRLWSGVSTGLTVAFATFLVYDVLILLRVNLFLDELTGRDDWQSMMARFRASDLDSLRLFVNLDYLKQAPLKLGVSCAIGALMGALGGSMAVTMSPCARVPPESLTVVVALAHLPAPVSRRSRPEDCHESDSRRDRDSGC